MTWQQLIWATNEVRSLADRGIELDLAQTVTVHVKNQYAALTCTGIDMAARSVGFGHRSEERWPIRPRTAAFSAGPVLGSRGGARRTYERTIAQIGGRHCYRG